MEFRSIVLFDDALGSCERRTLIVADDSCASTLLGSVAQTLHEFFFSGVLGRGISAKILEIAAEARIRIVLVFLRCAEVIHFLGIVAVSASLWASAWVQVPVAAVGRVVREVCMHTL